MKVIIIVGAAAIAAGAFWVDQIIKDQAQANYYQAVAAQGQMFAAAPVMPSVFIDNLTQANMQRMHDHIVAGEIAEGQH